MASKNKAQVQIHGLENTLMGAESQDYLRSVAQYVSRRMDELESVLPSRFGEQRLATLAAVNVADELFKAKDETANLRREIAELQAAVRRLQKEKERPE